MYIDIIAMSREIENKLMIYIAKKAFQTNVIEISITVLNVTIFCGPTVGKVSFSECKLCKTLPYFYLYDIFFLQ